MTLTPRLLSAALLPAVLLATSLFGATPGAAQTDCAAIADPQQRLACYDALHAPAAAPARVPDDTRATRPAAPDSAPAGTADTAEPESAATSTVEPQPVPPATPATGEVPPARTTLEPAAAGTPEEDFGAEQLPQAAKAERTPDAIHSRIVGRFDGWEQDTVFTLENGQQWRCAERSSASYRLPSPAVTIKRSWSGGYVMRVEGANRPVSVVRIR